MLLLALLATASTLVNTCHAQKVGGSASDITSHADALLASTQTKSRPPSPLITGTAYGGNGSTNLSNGMVSYDDASFATSCAYNDNGCASRCSWHHEACSRIWAAWSRTGLEKSMNSDAYTTQTQTFHEITQSLRIVNGYTYAMGAEITTKSGTKTISFWHPQLEIISTLASRPPCNTPTFSCSQQAWCNTNACTVQGGTVELLFWPSSYTSAKAQSNRTVPSAAARPVTAIYKNTTLTSPSVYLDYKTAYALNGCSQKVGGSYPGAILALDPDDLYSIDARNDFFVVTKTIGNELRTTSFYQSHTLDYQHLTGLPPGAAYQGMPVCVASGCGIITPSLFHPQLVVPTHIREMDPAWATCDLDWRGSWDPPIALSEAESITVPTQPADPIHTPPASPKSSIDSIAKVTSSPTESFKTSAVVSGEEEIFTKPSVSFTYSPIAPSSESHSVPTSKPSRSSDPSPEAFADSTTSAILPSNAAEPEGVESDAVSASQTVSVKPNGGMGITDTTSSAKDPIATSRADINSPTNAYEVLSEALGTITESLTRPPDIDFSGFASGTAGSVSLEISASDPGLESASGSQAIIDFGSKTIMVVHQTSDLVLIEDQSMGMQSPAIVVDGHTLSAVSDAIIIDGTTTVMLSNSPVTSQSSAVFTTGTYVLTASSWLPQGSALMTETTLHNSTTTSNVHALPSVETNHGSDMLPPVTNMPPMDGDDEGNATTEEESNADTSDASSVPKLPGLWYTNAVFLVIAVIR